MSLDKPVEGGHLHHWVTASSMSSLRSLYIFDQRLIARGGRVGATPHWMSILLLSAAVFRITRLITKDAFPLVARPRAWIQRHWDPFEDWNNWISRTREEQDLLLATLRKNGMYDSKGRPTELKRAVAYMATCAWCVSIWVSAGVTVFAVITPLQLFSWWWAPIMWLTASTVTGLISKLDED